VGTHDPSRRHPSLASLSAAPVVAEGATLTSFVTEVTVMLVVGLILSLFGIGLFCWLIFTLAVHALPFFVGRTAGMAAFHGGARGCRARRSLAVPWRRVTPQEFVIQFVVATFLTVLIWCLQRKPYQLTLCSGAWRLAASDRWKK
jgi:hypothetical protein